MSAASTSTMLSAIVRPTLNHTGISAGSPAFTVRATSNSASIDICAVDHPRAVSRLSPSRISRWQGRTGGARRIGPAGRCAVPATADSRAERL